VAMQFYLKDYSARVAGQRAVEKEQFSKMQVELARLNLLQQEMNNTGFVMNDALTKERQKVENARKKTVLLLAHNKALKEKMDKILSDKEDMSEAKAALNKELEEISVQNSGLHKEVELLRKNFDIALTVKSRLAQVQESMNGLIIKKGKENVLQLQLDSLGRELESINLYLAGIRDNKTSQGPVVQTAKPEEKKNAMDPGLELKYMGQVNDLKAQVNILTNENTVLKEKYLMAQDVTAGQKKILDAGSQKIFNLQTKLLETESALSQAQNRYQDLERSAAALRERYVANELEKEGLKVRLNKLTSELNEVRGKFLALLGKLSNIFKTPEGEIVSGSGTNLTGIIGVELIPNAAGEDKK